MKAQFRRSEVGLLPASDESREWFSKLKIGATVEGDFVQPRNPTFHRKFFALLQFAFEHWADTAPRLKHKDIEVQPDFERFRKDVTIMAGRYKPVVNLKNELRIEADSISFAKMSQEDFEKLYSQTIQVLLSKVFKDGGKWNEAYLREIVDQISGF